MAFLALHTVPGGTNPNYPSLRGPGIDRLKRVREVRVQKRRLDIDDANTELLGDRGCEHNPHRCNVSICGVAVKIQEDRRGLIKVNDGGRHVHVIAPLDLALIGIGHSDLKPLNASGLVIGGEAAALAGARSMRGAHCDNQ